MTLRNRVTPFGEIVAVAARGTYMGNRGTLHNPQREIVRDWQVRRWIACRLEFRGRRRQVMQPGRYTELFFLDEAAALADGHRPCAECRHADYQAFLAAWRTVHGTHTAHADAIDAVLHAERRRGPWQKRTYVAEADVLPDGSYIDLSGQAWLVLGNRLLAWSADGYTRHVRRPTATRVRVLTPPSVVAVLEAGYRADMHSSAQPVD